MSQPTREILWNIDHAWLMYVMFVPALLICFYGFWQKLAFIWQGCPDRSMVGHWCRRLWTTTLETVTQRRVIRSFLPGLFHQSIFWSFIILIIATTSVSIDMNTPWPIFRGNYYLGISLLADLAGGFFTFGLALAFLRRYVFKKAKLRSRPEDMWIHASFTFLMASGFLLEGIRIHYTSDPWAQWTPVGALFGWPFQWVGEESGRAIHLWTWWSHAAVTFAMIAAIPYTKLFHLFGIPLNYYFQSDRPRGALARDDIEALIESSTDDDISLGMTTSADSNWKQRLDQLNCVACGRCDDHCPAQLSGKELSPMGIMLGLRDQGLEDWRSKGEPAELVGSTVKTLSLWECRTCYACVDQCPAGIDQLSQIIDMRRSEVLMQGRVQPEAQAMLQKLEGQGNPFAAQDERLHWIEHEGFKVLQDGENVEALYWIGCATSFDQRKRNIARNVVRLLEAAGVSYAVLGKRERCSGDPARVVGDENLFQTHAKQQAQELPVDQFDYMVVNCPHCYNTFENEYPLLTNVSFKIIHHTELIETLIRQRRLQLAEGDGAFSSEKVTYHDPCYLGRVQNVYEQPRSLLRKAVGSAGFVELKNHSEKSFCCGAGGGHYWMDIQEGGERLNGKRVKEVLESGAQTVAVGCPFCMQMMEDGLRAHDAAEKVVVRDIADIIVDRLPAAPNS